MWTSAYDHIQKKWRPEWLEFGRDGYRRADGLQIRFMRGCGYQNNVSIRRFVDHWLAARDFLRQASYLDAPDALIVSLPDHLTAAAAVKYGWRQRVPTIVDVRDKWPDIFLDRISGRFFKPLVRVGLVTERRRTSRLLKRAHGLVAVMHSLMEWALTRSGRQLAWQHRVFYLTTSAKNFDLPDVAHSDDPLISRLINSLQGRTVFTFVGTFNQTQNPNLILDALDVLASRGQSDDGRIAVVIAGDGNGSAALRERATRYPSVSVLGWLTEAQMRRVLAASHVGILAMNFPSPAFNNKAFAYLASGLPIINGATGDLAAILSDEHAGINVLGGDARALADAIAELARDETRRLALAQNARRVFEERFDRDANYRAYADHVERLAEDFDGL